MGHFEGRTTVRRSDTLRKQLRRKLVWVPNYQNTIGETILENYFCCHFFRQVDFFFKIFFPKKSELGGPVLRIRGGGHPRVGGWKMRAKTPATLSAVLFRKLTFFEKICSTMPPPPGPPPWTPHFFQILFQFWSTGAPFYIFFFYYITVFLSIFSLFLFTFFSIIECRAVVLQPPQ